MVWIKGKHDQKIAVFDLGGGTFDIPCTGIGRWCVWSKITNGDTHLGGDDFDKVIMDWLADELKTEAIDLRKDPIFYSVWKKRLKKQRLNYHLQAKQKLTCLT